MAEKTANRKKYLVMLSATLGVALLICAVVSFPVIKFYGQTVWLFAPARIARPDYFPGRVLGDHVFETEYGEITLKHSAMIQSEANTISDIEPEVFASGKASHGLVIDGIEIPPNAYIGFRYSPNEVSYLNLYGEITVGGLSLNVERFDLSYSKSTADIVMEIHGAPEYIMLSDSTQIYTEKGRPLGIMSIFKETEIWELVYAWGIFVKLPGETEFTKYRSITFGENWGAFIEGELFVPEDPEAERERMDKMLNDLSNSISIYGSRN